MKTGAFVLAGSRWYAECLARSLADEGGSERSMDWARSIRESFQDIPKKDRRMVARYMHGAIARYRDEQRRHA